MLGWAFGPSILAYPLAEKCGSGKHARPLIRTTIRDPDRSGSSREGTTQWPALRGFFCALTPPLLPVPTWHEPCEPSLLPNGIR